MRYADLHLHTYHSDGTRSPREVIDAAKTHGLGIVAISDHDNLAAWFEIKPYADSSGITLIPAMELSCIFSGADVHILAYAFDPTDERIEKRLAEFRNTRARRGHEMIGRLRELGVEVNPERVDQLAGGGAMGRPHIARAMVEAGHVTSVDEAFDRYLGWGKPAFVDKQRFSIEEAVELIHSAGGLTSIAHPAVYPNHAKIVPQVLDAGIDGVEVFHPDVDETERERYRNLARFRGKMITGGSDDHGTAKSTQTLGTIRVPEDLIAPILERLSSF